LADPTTWLSAHEHWTSPLYQSESALLRPRPHGPPAVTGPGDRSVSDGKPSHSRTPRRRPDHQPAPRRHGPAHPGPTRSRPAANGAVRHL